MKNGYRNNNVYFFVYESDNGECVYICASELLRGMGGHSTTTWIGVSACFWGIGFNRDRDRDRDRDSDSYRDRDWHR